VTTPVPDEIATPEWAVLFYLCGHYNRPDLKDPFLTALDEIRKVGASGQVGIAAYLDLESGARRIAIRPGDAAQDSEGIGAVNSGAPETLEQFITWAFDACPARRYILVMAGLGIMDSHSVVGRPPFDAARLFAICDDRATDDAIELHELSDVLRRTFPEEGPRRLIMLACDMYATQFMEVAYELREYADFLVGLQPDDRTDAPGLQHWPYARLVERWQEVLRTPLADGGPRWRFGFDKMGEALARETVSFLSTHYVTSPHGTAPPVTVSAINLRALMPLAQALDTFSVVFLQWLSNDVIWRAREQVFSKHKDLLQHAWSYDLDAVASSVQASLIDAAHEAVARWAGETLPKLGYARLAEGLRILVSAARDTVRRMPADTAVRALATELARCRSELDQAIAVAAEDARHAAATAELLKAVRRLFIVEGDPPTIRHAEAWTMIFGAARDRLPPSQAKELADAFEGVEAAGQLGRLARRVSELTRGPAGEGQAPAIVAVWPPGQRSGLSLYRPIDLDKLAESNYLELRFSRELHWTALLTAIDLIKNHACMLWRLLESQLTAAPLEARYQLMRRLAGERALTGRHANQLRALSAPEALFLTLEPVVDADEREPAADRRTSASDAPVGTYCVRLASLDRAATVVERRNRVTRDRLARVLAEIDAIGDASGARPADLVQRLARCGSLLGDDILFGVGDRLADVEPQDDRPVHLVLQMPRELMRYPWELLRDRRGWLVDRFAIGRQVIADADSAGRWARPRRQGPLRLLVVAPKIAGSGVEVSGAGEIEGAKVAECFERLMERLPGLVEELPFREHIGVEITVDRFRELLRDGRYDVVHFAGHGRYNRDEPEQSAWQFSDGPLYAFELRHTLANAERTPWLMYGSACESGREAVEARRGSHEGVYGMASAALAEGVAAYIAPLWKIPDIDATNLATAFYQALLLRRTSVGEALAVARRLVKEDRGEGVEMLIPILREPDAEDARPPEVRSAGWAGIVLYGDPTPTILQRLSPSDAIGARGNESSETERPAAAGVGARALDSV